MEAQQVFYTLASLFMVFALILLIIIAYAIWRIYTLFHQVKKKGNMVAEMVGSRVRRFVKKRA